MAHFSAMTQDLTDLQASNRRPGEPGTRRTKAPIRLRRGIVVTERPILIVEDEYLIATDLATQIVDDGGTVIGPAMSIQDAHQLLRCTSDIGAAILDVKLGQSDTFELAHSLNSAGIPFVFYTGYRSIAIPDRFIDVPRIVKPAGWRQVKHGLAAAMERLSNTGTGSFRKSIEAALPGLRRRARRIAANHEDADRLVEATLERAISAVARRSLDVTIEEWLTSLLLDSTPAEARHRLFH
jgi:CheY-like chemotaxis protein